MNTKKLRGAYFTSAKIAKILTAYAVRNRDDAILEPSCGDGVFLETAMQTLRRFGAEDIPSQLVGIEIDPETAVTAQASLGIPIANDDFFGYAYNHLWGQTLFSQRRRFDAVVGNPPYIRAQYFTQQTLAMEMMTAGGFAAQKMASAWLPFLVVSSLLLKQNGRIAMVIPEDLLHAKYAKETREFLTTHFRELIIISLDDLVFDGALQNVVLVMGERGTPTKPGAQIARCKTADGIEVAILEARATDAIPPEKWNSCQLGASPQLLEPYLNHTSVKLLGEMASIEVGVLTGANKFFVLSQEQVSKYDAQPFARQVVGKTSSLSGLVFGQADWRQPKVPSWLLSLPAHQRDKFPASMIKLIELGESMKVHTNYKCRIRPVWYSVPTGWEPGAFLPRHSHATPHRIVLNRTDATCTDSLMRLRFDKPGFTGGLATAAFPNTLTLLAAETIGRPYSAGLLGLTPGTARQLPIPTVNADKLCLDQIDHAWRTGGFEAAMDIVDHALLIEGMGMNVREHKQLRSAWHEVRQRRINKRNIAA